MFKTHLITALVAMAVCTYGNARPLRDNEVTYFSDKTMKTAVGTLYMDCYGNVTRTGIVEQGKTTKFWVRYQEVCPGHSLGGIGPNCYIDGLLATCSPGMTSFFRQT